MSNNRKTLWDILKEAFPTETMEQERLRRENLVKITKAAFDEMHEDDVDLIQVLLSKHILNIGKDITDEVDIIVRDSQTGNILMEIPKATHCALNVIDPDGTGVHMFLNGHTLILQELLVKSLAKLLNKEGN